MHDKSSKRYVTDTPKKRLFKKDSNISGNFVYPRFFNEFEDGLNIVDSKSESFKLTSPRTVNNSKLKSPSDNLTEKRVSVQSNEICIPTESNLPYEYSNDFIITPIYRDSEGCERIDFEKACLELSQHFEKEKDKSVSDGDQKILNKVESNDPANLRSPKKHALNSSSMIPTNDENLVMHNKSHSYVSNASTPVSYPSRPKKQKSPKSDHISFEESFAANALGISIGLTDVSTNETICPLSSEVNNNHLSHSNPQNKDENRMNDEIPEYIKASNKTSVKYVPVFTRPNLATTAMFKSSDPQNVKRPVDLNYTDNNESQFNVNASNNLELSSLVKVPNNVEPDTLSDPQSIPLQSSQNKKLFEQKSDSEELESIDLSESHVNRAKVSPQSRKARKKRNHDVNLENLDYILPEHYHSDLSGVYFHVPKKEWRAVIGKGSRRQQKTFSVRKYGFFLAKQQAEYFRTQFNKTGRLYDSKRYIPSKTEKDNATFLEDNTELSVLKEAEAVKSFRQAKRLELSNNFTKLPGIFTASPEKVDAENKESFSDRIFPTQDQDIKETVSDSECIPNGDIIENIPETGYSENTVKSRLRERSHKNYKDMASLYFEELLENKKIPKQPKHKTFKEATYSKSTKPSMKKLDFSEFDKSLDKNLFQMNVKTSKRKKKDMENTVFDSYFSDSTETVVFDSTESIPESLIVQYLSDVLQPPVITHEDISPQNDTISHIFIEQLNTSLQQKHSQNFVDDEEIRKAYKVVIEYCLRIVENVLSSPIKCPVNYYRTMDDISCNTYKTISKCELKALYFLLGNILI